jgi:hypothetical protein
VKRRLILTPLLEFSLRQDATHIFGCGLTQSCEIPDYIGHRPAFRRFRRAKGHSEYGFNTIGYLAD